MLTFGYRYYPFISSRAGFAFHNEYAIMGSEAPPQFPVWT